MAEKTKTKVKRNKGTENVISIFVVLMIVLSVFAASVATVIAQDPIPPPPPPEPTSIAVTADPESIAANGVATSILTATALSDGAPATGHTLTFEKISGPADAVLVGADGSGELYLVTDGEGKAYATLLAGATLGTVEVKVSYTGTSGEVSDTTTVNLTDPNVPDTTPPYTSGYDPAENATNVPIDTNIVVHVKDDGAGVDLNTIEMRVEGALVEPVITGPTADYTLTYNPPADFDYDQVVDVTIDADDLNATTPNAMSQHVYSFTTQPVPVYDVNLTVDDETKSTTPGVNATYTLTVKNTGNVNDMFNLVIDGVPENATATLSESVTPELAPDGTYDISLNVSGAIEDEYIVNVTATSQGDISASDNVTTKTNVIEIGSVTGTITYACNETGIADVTVNLTQGSVVASTTTDNDGNYTFTDVKAGNYYVNASKLRFGDNSTDVTVIADVITEAETMILWLEGDLNNNGISADPGDLAMMKEASVIGTEYDWYDLNNNGLFADPGDLAMMKEASTGKIVLI